MTDYDYDRPFIEQKSLPQFRALDAKTARYGARVRATPLSNIEYKLRFDKLKDTRNMMPPPSCGRIFMGYLVVRNMDTKDQYETWFADDAFEEVYEPVET